MPKKVNSNYTLRYIVKNNSQAWLSHLNGHNRENNLDT